MKAPYCVPFALMLTVLAALASQFPTAVLADEAPGLLLLEITEEGELRSKFGYVDRTGHAVIPFRFDDAKPFAGNRALVRIGAKSGFIDDRGALVVAAKYDEANSFSEGRATVREGKSWGVIDESGREVVPPTYQQIFPYHEGLAIFLPHRKSGEPARFGALDLAGNVAIAPVHEQLGGSERRFADGRALVRIDKKLGFLGKDGEIAIAAIFDWAETFESGLAIVGIGLHGGGARGMIDIFGKPIVPVEYDRIIRSSDGSTLAQRKDAAFQFIDKGTNRLPLNVPLKYLCSEWQDRKLVVNKAIQRRSENGHCYFVDAAGNSKFDRGYIRASKFRNGLAVVWVSAQEAFGAVRDMPQKTFAGVIDEAGKFVVQPVYDSVSVQEGGLMSVHWEGRQGYLDHDGRPLTFARSEIDAYIAEMRDAYSLAGQVPGRTITARAAELDYHLYLPPGICVLAEGERANALVDDFVKTTIGDQSASTPGESTATAPNKPPPRELVSAAFTACDQAADFRKEGRLDKLTWIGTATGTRKGRPDPSVMAGLSWMARIICGSARTAELATYPGLHRRARLSRAWSNARQGKAAALPAGNERLLGCTSAYLAPGGEGSVSAGTVTFAFVPDWSSQIWSRTHLHGEDDLINLLREQGKILDALTNLNLRVREH